MFSGAPPIFVLVFVLILGVFAFILLRNLLTAVHNLGQPVITRPARIVAKRQSVSVHGGHGNVPASSSTTYYATFEFADGSREEFSLPGRTYGLLAEGDAGTLTSQGTWFKGFDRGPGAGGEE